MSIKEWFSQSAEVAFAHYVIARLRRGLAVNEQQLIEAALILQWQIEQIDEALYAITPEQEDIGDVLQRSIHRAPR